MCEHDKKPFVAPAEAAAAAPAKGSRRKRLWDLPHSAHCPIVGVCVPLAPLRKMMDKTFGGQSEFDDYHLHVGVVAQCTTRNLVSETLQRDLDRRFASALRAFSQAKTSLAVGELWRVSVEGGEFAAGLWAALTHPRCEPELCEQICRDIHMIQHQAGASVRADLEKVDALIHKNRTLAEELARLQERSAQALAERQQERDALTARLLRLRAESIAKDTSIARLREEQRMRESAVPDLETRLELKQRVAELAERVLTLQRELTTIRNERSKANADAAKAPALVSFEPATVAAPALPRIQLEARSVLCVGGRSGHIPLYRDLVERHGGRFMHHDGGLEDSTRRLDANLAAADLVICQTGCLSHNAYWLVKEHCKRTGKRCVYVDKPGAGSFLRGLAHLPAPQSMATTTDEPELPQ